MRRLLLPLLAGCVALSAFAAAAQDWPNKPIRIVVPFPSGGTTDTAVRPLADRLSQQLGVSVVVDNKPGAAGRIGYEFAAKANQDGYTLLAGTDSLGLQPHLEPPPNYDPIRDFAPIAQLSSQPLVIAVHPSLGVTTLQQLVELGRTRRDAIGYATDSDRIDAVFPIESLGDIYETPLLRTLKKSGVTLDLDRLPKNLPL